MNVIISNQANDLLSSMNIDVIKKINGVFSSDEIVSNFSNFYYERLILDITALKDYTDIKNLQKLSINLDASKMIILLDGSSYTSSSEFISKLISVGIYNFTKNVDGIMYLMSHPNSYKDVANLQKIDEQPDEYIKTQMGGTKIIGVKNLTDHAGSTTLIYKLKNQLEKNYKVIAIEIDKKDFVYFNDRNMFSFTNDQFNNELLKINSNVEVILVDLNNSNQEKCCNDVIYLLEPSIIMLNKLISRNRNILNNISGKKVILNKSMLSPKDINEFEMEANIKTFYSLPPINDRMPSVAVDNFLVRLGFFKQKNSEENSNSLINDGILGLFKHKS